jgi:hypothetical protein
MNYIDYSTEELLTMYNQCLSYDACSFDDQEANTEQMHKLAYELRVTRHVAIQTYA